VIGSDHRLLGVVTLQRLIAAGAGVPVSSLMDTTFPTVAATDDQERAASVALHHASDALPVLDGDKYPLGVMPSQALLQVLRREHVEDLHVLAGIQRESAQARHAIEEPPLRRARHRLPWLLAGFLGSMIATGAMAGFESTLNQHVAIAFFVPAIVYLADAIGTQTEAIAVRGLSLTRSGIGHLLGGELRTGMLLGSVLGLLSLPLVWAVFGELRLAAAVATALFAAGSMAATVGLLFPWLLARSRRDPAYGSGPLATIIQDVLSLLVYLAVVKAFGL
jgi:magnesium transporter